MHELTSAAPGRASIVMHVEELDQFREWEANVAAQLGQGAAVAKGLNAWCQMSSVAEAACRRVANARFGVAYPAMPPPRRSLLVEDRNKDEWGVGTDAPGGKLHLSYPSSRAANDLGRSVRKQLRWHQEQGVFHFSHTYGPPHPANSIVAPPPSLGTDPAVVSGMRMILVAMEDAAVASMVCAVAHPLHPARGCRHSILVSPTHFYVVPALPLLRLPTHPLSRAMKRKSCSPVAQPRVVLRHGQLRWQSDCRAGRRHASMVLRVAERQRLAIAAAPLRGHVATALATMVAPPWPRPQGVLPQARLPPMRCTVGMRGLPRKTLCCAKRCCGLAQTGSWCVT